MNNKKTKTVPELRFHEFKNLEEWKKKQFAKLFKIGCGRDYKHLGNGDIPVYGTGGYMLSVNDFLYDGKSACIGRKGTINKPMLLSGKFWTVDTLFYTHSFKDCSPEFVYLLFQNINWLTYNEAGGVPSLSRIIIDKIEVYIPKLEEQEKIVNFISSIDNLITAETAKLAHLKAHKKGLLQQLFPINGETTPQYRFPKFKNDGDWKETTLGNVAKFRRGSFPQPYGRSEWYDDENGIPFVQVYDVDTNLKLKPKTKRKISDIAAKQSVYIKKGTVIITIQGSIGRVAITQYDAYIDRTLLLFEEFYTQIDKLFFAYVIQILFEIEKQKAPGGIIKTITKEVLTSFNIYIPEIEEQLKIAQCLFSLDELITAQAENIKALKKHKKGLLQQLFPDVNDVEA
ncbi:MULTISPECIES: restriction endonuclease subunit S [Bizionia]|uniref:Restriction endonuclease subunit S n=1 Tax=Bizionia algoritergicola TaxID=291187 RepID=A0A5D0QU69_9FLAO|nr:MULTISPECIES: restriction endonuclease subunit S [Bizionia]OBX22020.1 hypothetical protein BAA08_10090 [Bizionia sp. APA-3]TYB71978.1 restriction endonuclease subunit S [Bizionia algoritergicola]